MNWVSVRTPIDHTCINNLEKDFKIKLPKDYKNQIGPINGGALKDASINVPCVGKVPYSRNVSLHKGAKAGIYDLIGCLNAEKITLFPFASVGNGDYFCFDLSSNTVVLYHHERQKTRYVCNTFTELMNQLVCE